MGGFGQTLKGFLFEDTSQKSESGQTAAVPTIPIQGVIPQQVQNSHPAESTENSPAYKALAESVLSKDTGFSRLLKSVKPLESVIPDETQRLRAALAILNGNGLSTEEIVKSIAVHDGMLKTEKRRFDEDLNAQLATKVGVLDSECAALEADVKKKSEELTRIQREISEAENKKAR